MLHEDGGALGLAILCKEMSRRGFNVIISFAEVTSNVEDEKLLNMSKKLNVFRKHHREIRKLEKINEKHERQTDYDVRDEHDANKTKE